MPTLGRPTRARTGFIGAAAWAGSFGGEAEDAVFRLEADAVGDLFRELEKAGKEKRRKRVRVQSDAVLSVQIRNLMSRIS